MKMSTWCAVAVKERQPPCWGLLEKRLKITRAILYAAASSGILYITLVTVSLKGIVQSWTNAASKMVKGLEHRYYEFSV